MGKGDNYRPTDQPKYNENYDQIDWGDDEQRAPINDAQTEMPLRRPHPKLRRDIDG